MKTSFRKNWIHYCQEAIGLAIFMIAACYFSALLEFPASQIHRAIPGAVERMLISAVLMGGTALFIFYSPITAPSGSQINPAVTITFWRLGKMCPWDSLFFILFQFAGGTLAVILMQGLLGPELTDAPVRSVVTVPGPAGVEAAAAMEFFIGFVTMLIVLFCDRRSYWKKHSRLIVAGLVAAWVIVAGPVSGFGMNPARSFASALPSNIWTSFWIYLAIPVFSMLAAAELILALDRQKKKPGPAFRFKSR